MRRLIKKVGYDIKNARKSTVFMALSIAVAVAYYFNLLTDLPLMKWDRTFGPATISNISVNSRIGNWYLLFLAFLPIVSCALIILLTFVLEMRPLYKKTFFIFSSFLAIISLAAYISRYSMGNTDINDNPIMEIFLIFFMILLILAIIDKEQKISFSDYVLILIYLAISVASCSILFNIKNVCAIIIANAVIIILIVAFALNIPICIKNIALLRNFVLLLMWLPALLRLSLETIYYLTANGRGIDRYFTHIFRSTCLFLIVFILLAVCITKAKKTLTLCGYIGAIVSFSVIGTFPSTYQYIFSYSSYTNLFEVGNNAVAIDTYLYGKIPIIDYFSAHALSDIWTRLIYCLFYGDVKGILVDPYSGLNIVIAFVILFYIISQIFTKDVAVLFVLLFPGIVRGIKFTSICFISVALLICIIKKASRKSYVVFWICVLISAFTIYDEGMSLSVACIISYMFMCFVQKEYKRLRDFILCGTFVGIICLAFYTVYAYITGISLFGRIKEWISVSLGSNSIWGTVSIGDQSSFAFLVSYFIVPMMAILVLCFVIIGYLKRKTNQVLVGLTMTFSIAEILYFPRTIIFHNLWNCQGVTGVLLNFIHWTVAIYALYLVTEKERQEEIKSLVFAGTMIVIILIEGVTVTQLLPTSNSSIVNLGIIMAKTWNLSDNYTENKGKARIVYDEDTERLVGSFDQIFDTLLTQDETFIDFSNITSLYLLTEKNRPYYVGQSPSLLTDLYSQECYIDEVRNNNCPLAVLGTTDTPYLQQMEDVPHNIRYYKVAEYIYNNYRPLVTFGEFAIWCNKDKYDAYKESLLRTGLLENGYTLIDYGYDFTEINIDEKDEQYIYKPYHSYDLKQIPYLWANFDEYVAIDNPVIESINQNASGNFVFEGSQNVSSDNGSYLKIQINNSSNDSVESSFTLYDSNNTGARIKYSYTVESGSNYYLFRVSADYFWDIFNLDTICLENNNCISVQSLQIVEGD